MKEMKVLRVINSFSRLHRYTVDKFYMLVSVLFLGFMLSSTASAHRGAKNEVDTCRFSVGSEVIHFSAYTPKSTGGTGYCHYIPDVELTHLVFDYEGKKLRNTTVEFEITKEPEATRVFYQKPEKIKKGSMDAKVDFSQYGAGDYLAHVTIVHQGEKLDSHLPFSVGVEPESSGFTFMIVMVLIIVAIIAVVMMRVFKPKEN